MIIYFKRLLKLRIASDTIVPAILPVNQDFDGEYDPNDSNDLFELLGNLDDCTAALVNASRKSTENKYIEETIEAVENVGRFTNVNGKYYFNVFSKLKNNDNWNIVVVYVQSSLNKFTNHTDQQLVPFLSPTSNHIRLNARWQE